MKYAIYLAKNGETIGPFTAEEFEAIRQSGKIREYSAIFDSRSNSWQPLEAAPPPPPSFAPAPEVPSARGTAELAPPAARPTLSRKPTRAIEALCHNRRDILSGSLDRLSDAGCDFLAVESDGAGPRFAEKGPVLLNLLDPATGESINVQARMLEAARAKEGWIYRLGWQSCPEFLLTAVAG